MCVCVCVCVCGERVCARVRACVYLLACLLGRVLRTSVAVSECRSCTAAFCLFSLPM